MAERVELGMTYHTQAVLIQKRDTGGMSLFVSLPQVSVALECTSEQAVLLAQALLSVAGERE